MMKNLILFLIISVFVITVNAQSNIRLNNYWDNTYYINPGSINDNYHAVFSVAARKQWLGFPGSPNTLFATGTFYISKMNTQFGMKVFNDKLGYNSISNVALSYSYSANINRFLQLNMGIAASYQSLSYDRDEVSVMTADDPALYDNLLQQNNYNADVGIEFVTKSLKAGLSCQNLMTILDKDNHLQINSNYLYAIYRKNTENSIDMQYGIAAIQYDDLYQMEFNITTFFKDDQKNDLFHVGLFYRTKNEMGLLLGCNLGESFQLGYSYDFNVSGISKSSIGTHELMLIYKLEKIRYKQYKY